MLKRTVPRNILREKVYVSLPLKIFCVSILKIYGSSTNLATKVFVFVLDTNDTVDYMFETTTVCHQLHYIEKKNNCGVCNNNNNNWQGISSHCIFSVVILKLTLQETSWLQIMRKFFNFDLFKKICKKLFVDMLFSGPVDGAGNKFSKFQ